QILAAVALWRRADADEGQVGIRDGNTHVVGDLDIAAAHHLLRELLDSLLDDRRLARAKQIELHRIDIHAGDLMTIAREASKGYRADIAEAKDADLHDFVFSNVCSSGTDGPRSLRHSRIAVS